MIMRHNINVTNRQINWMIAIVVFIAVGSFGAGYFWGEKKSAERFLQRIGQEAFSDQVYSSICSLYDSDNESDQRGENVVTEAENVPEETSKQEVVATTKESAKKMVPREAFYAQLVGFGTSKKAKQFVERLSKKGITAHVRDRKSKTARGKLITWYQVVTDPYTDKDALITLVEKVKADEHLHDVRIITI